MSLNDVWEGAAGSPFYPAVSKDKQFLVGFTLLLIGEPGVERSSKLCADPYSVCFDRSFRAQ